jgi:hypothetical protein
MNEGLYGSPLIMFAGSLLQVEKALVGSGSTAADVKKAMDMANNYRKEFLGEENKTSDRTYWQQSQKCIMKIFPRTSSPRLLQRSQESIR